jgi:hypothetical protein
VCENELLGQQMQVYLSMHSARAGCHRARRAATQGKHQGLVGSCPGASLLELAPAVAATRSTSTSSPPTWVSWLRETRVQLVTAPATYLPRLSCFTIRSSAAVALKSCGGDGWDGGFARVTCRGLFGLMKLGER